MLLIKKIIDQNPNRGRLTLLVFYAVCLYQSIEANDAPVELISNPQLDGVGRSSLTHTIGPLRTRLSTRRQLEERQERVLLISLERQPGTAELQTGRTSTEAAPLAHSRSLLRSSPTSCRAPLPNYMPFVKSMACTSDPATLSPLSQSPPRPRAGRDRPGRASDPHRHLLDSHRIVRTMRFVTSTAGAAA